MALIDTAVGAYRGAFPQRQLRAELPAEPVTLEARPDLIVQMLDKLIDNAVDFIARGRDHHGAAGAEAAPAVLEVDNPGPALPLQPSEQAVRVAVAIAPGAATAGRISGSGCTSCG